MSAKLSIALFCALSILSASATPANKAALQRHFGPFLGKDLDRCTTCHLPSANKNPESLDEFPHNAFGKSIRALGKSKSIAERLTLLAKQDADNDGVSNETELLLGHNPGEAKDTPGKSEQPRTSDFRKFLASYQWRPFDAVKQPAVPKVKNKSWVRNPVDAFIAAQHESRNLKPRPEASKEILLRRIYLDLIGLSPTPAEIEAFLNDTSPKAYEKVVDQLLADERYGERWGRHWLDVWRYSDWAGWSGGNQIRDSKPHIWRWRDWTIESLNRDKPYDQMIVEMLAADELAPNDTNALRATGFLVRNYKMLSREQWLEDTVKHTSQAFLGVTVGCAKCHNHMYDPISQKEYYQMRAIFEPHQVRTDRIPGQTDTAKDGLVRAYDVGTNPPTYFFIRGDERKPDTNRVIQPGVPKSLKGSFEVMPVILPQTAAHPDNRKFVIDDQLRESEAAIAAAQKEEKHRELKTQIAIAKHEALLTLLELEANSSTNLAKKAVSQERQIAVLEAKLKVEQTEKEEEKKKAQTKLEEAEKLAGSEPDTNFKPRAT
ncbi:MAG TPA: DUF1549 domain-containing protein, partial [Verrucomicrobiae bacterium]|nr:DUF1549 domain-containing protein [Verrucomicrobiae bacterium]